MREGGRKRRREEDEEGRRKVEGKYGQKQEGPVDKTTEKEKENIIPQNSKDTTCNYKHVPKEIRKENIKLKPKVERL